MYWISPPVRRAFAELPKLGEIAPPRQGLATTDNSRFVRYWWEVEPTHRDASARATPGRWLPYVKSGQFRRWYEAPRHRVNWEDDGREIKQSIVDRYPYLNGQWQWVAKNAAYYRRGGVTWSYLTSGRFSARRLEEGAIFDVAGSSLFPADVPAMLALLNSSAVHRLLEAINPTVNFQVGDLAELPIPPAIPEALGALATSAIRIQQTFDAFDETAPDFAEPMPWSDAEGRMRSMERELARIESEIDAAVGDLFGLGVDSGLHDPPIHGAPAPVARTDLACRWVGFAVGLLLGRWNAGEPGRVLRLDPPDPRVIADVRNLLASRAGERAAGEIDACVGGIGAFLAGGFFPWHTRIYRRRPPFWAIGGRGKLYLLAHDAATPTTLAPILRAAGADLPSGWRRCVDDGIALGLAPLRSLLPDPTLRHALDKVAADVADGRFPWMKS